MTDFAPPLDAVFMVDYPSLAQPSAPATLPDADFDLVQRINNYWNDAIVPDESADWRPWKVLQPGQSGVCHDYAVTKLSALVGIGLPRGALALAWLHDVRCPGEDHMVLLANFATIGVYVLDNMFRDLAKMSDLINYGWKGREVWGDPTTWVAV